MPRGESPFGLRHHRFDLFAILSVSDVQKRGAVTHHGLGGDSIYGVHSRADIEELAFPLLRQAPLENHARHVVGNEGQPLTDNPALLSRQLVIGDVELNAEDPRRQPVRAPLDYAPCRQYPAPRAILRSQAMVAAKAAATAFEHLL